MDCDSPGRSGAKFLLSYDKKFVVKTLVSEEVAEMHHILKEYHQVCQQTHIMLQQTYILIRISPGLSTDTHTLYYFYVYGEKLVAYDSS